MIIERTEVNSLTGTQLKVSGAMQGTRFENRDGNVAFLADHRLTLLKLNGYTEPVEIRDEFGYTELGMDMGCMHSIGVVAFTRPDSHCAYVLCADGTFTSGSFHRFADGTFSLA